MLSQLLPIARCDDLLVEIEMIVIRSAGHDGHFGALGEATMGGDLRRHSHHGPEV
jgi:hypothetical protein